MYYILIYLFFVITVILSRYKNRTIINYKILCFFEIFFSVNIKNVD